MACKRVVQQNLHMLENGVYLTKRDILLWSCIAFDVSARLLATKTLLWTIWGNAVSSAELIDRRAPLRHDPFAPSRHEPQQPPGQTRPPAGSAFKLGRHRDSRPSGQ